MCALVLLHIIFPCEGFVTGRAMDVFLASVFLAVARGVAGGGECVGAGISCRVRAWVFLLGSFRGC